MSNNETPRILAGQRFAVCGRSGSGKTYLEKWLMFKSTLKWIVIDSKHDPGFDEMKPNDGLLMPTKVERLWNDRRHVVVRPTARENDVKTLDEYLEELHESFDNFGVCIDETYQVAMTSKAGPGLTGLVTRGRARKQAVILGSQRPAWVPRFVFSEANAIIVMALTMKQDRERIYEMTEQPLVLKPVEPRHWLFCDVAKATVEKFSPVTIKEG